MPPWILIVEPYPDLRAEIAAVLRREHYQCDAFASAQEAARALEQREYSHLLVDGDTYDWNADVMLLARHAGVIVMTETENDFVERRATPRHTLRKPFGRDELMKELE
jgi:DNA-binding response OmpR family regulator